MKGLKDDFKVFDLKFLQIWLEEWKIRLFKIPEDRTFGTLTNRAWKRKQGRRWKSSDKEKRN